MVDAGVDDVDDGVDVDDAGINELMMVMLMLLTLVLTERSTNKLIHILTKKFSSWLICCFCGEEMSEL